MTWHRIKDFKAEVKVGDSLRFGMPKHKRDSTNLTPRVTKVTAIGKESYLAEDETGKEFIGHIPPLPIPGMAEIEEGLDVWRDDENG